MAIQVVALEFNHDPASARTSALNVRTDVSRAVAVPEWRRGVHSGLVPSVAAYSIADTRDQAIRVRVHLRTLLPHLTSVELRAIQPPDMVVPWWLPFAPHPEFLFAWRPFFLNVAEFAAFQSYAWWYYVTHALAQTTSNVLGDVVPRRVQLDPNGTTAATEFDLSDVRLATRGVNAHRVRWLWQFRRGPGEPWTDIGITDHRIYALLDTPTAPWTQQPFTAANTTLPWTSVLDVACAWAAGATTADDAARLITEAVFQLGATGVLEYGCEIGTFSMYTHPLTSLFDCTAFLERLRGGVGHGPYVNCTDCASIVTTFANAIGCDLWSSRMGRYAPPFDTHPILAIGGVQWRTPCGWGTGFTYHEVAWKGACEEDDAIFDACLALDRDGLPGLGPHTGFVPANLAFGRPGDGLYRDLLTSVPDRESCAPRPAERTRRLPI